MYLRIRDLREDRDLDQEDIAEILGCVQQTYSKYENEEIQISIDSLIKLADFYKTSIDYLVGLTDEFKPYPKSNKK